MVKKAPPTHNVSTLRGIVSYTKPYKFAVFAAFCALTVTAVSVLVLGKQIGLVVDQGFGHHNQTILDRGLLMVWLTILVLALGSFARSYLVTYVSNQIMTSVQRDLYAHLLYLPAAYFERNKTGDILSRLTLDTTLLHTMISTSISVALRNGMMLLGGLVMMILTSYQLASIVAAVIVVIVLPIMILGRKVRALSKITQAQIATTTSYLDEAIQGIKTIQAFTHEPLEIKQFRTLTDAVLSASKAKLIYRSSLVALVISCVFGAVAFVLWIGGHQVMANHLSTGQLSSFLFYAVIVATSSGSISEIAGDIQRALGAAERLTEFMQEPTTLAEYPASAEVSVAPLSTPPRLRFEKVTFSYSCGTGSTASHALHDINLVIEPGETLAIVGPSGAGKSTLFELLLRFYEPQEGRIFLGNSSIDALPLATLRHAMGVVPQHPLIFSGSAYDNIRMGNPAASDADIIEAAKAAACYDFLASLPEGLHTLLGEKGIRLSGGERQRVAIARVFLKNPPILLLDEATSALDTANEQLVRSAFEQLMAHRTSLIIAHRLSTIQKADRIIVLDKGRIVETGTHQSLLQQGGLYAHLAQLQFDQS